MVNGVEVEANGRRDFNWHRPDFHVEFHRVERGHHLAVKIGDGLRTERQGSSVVVRGADDELVIDEIELNAEGTITVRERARGETAGRYLHSNAPGMIERRCLSKRDFADDLRPHMQRRVGIFPGFVRQRRPQLFGQIF